MKKKVKILGFISAVFVFVAFGIILSLPTIVSTNWGLKQAEKLVNSQIPGTISVKNVSLSWIGAQVFEGVTLKSLEGETIVSFDSFQTRTPLIKFLIFGPCVEKIDLKGLYLNIVEEYPEVTNFQQALGKKEINFNNKRENLFIKLPLTSKIALKSKKPRNFRKPEPIILKDVNLSIDSTTFAKPITFSLKGTSLQGELAGKFAVDATFMSGFAKHWRFNRNAEVKIKAEVFDFPVDILDIALTHDQPDYQGVLRDIIGNKISITIDQALSCNDGAFTICSKTPNFTADMIAKLNGNKLSLVEAGSVDFTLTPELFDRIATNGHITSLLKLSRPAQTRLTIDSLSLPIDFEDLYPNAINFAGLEMKAKLDFDEINLPGSPIWGDITLKELKSTIESSETSKSAIWQLTGEANQNGNHLRIKLDAAIYKPKENENFFDTIRKQTDLHIELAGVPLVKLNDLNPKILMERFFGPRPLIKIAIQNKEGYTGINGSLTTDNTDRGFSFLNFNLGQSENRNVLEFRGETALNGKVIGSFSFFDSCFNGVIQTGKLKLATGNSSVMMEEFYGSIKKNHKGTHFEMQDHPLSGFFKLQASLGADYIVDCEFKKAPLTQFLKIFNSSSEVTSQVETLFGNSINGLIKGKVKKGKGPFLLDLTGPKGKLFVDGNVFNGEFKLNHPVKGQFHEIPFIGKNVFPSNLPFLQCQLDLENFITLTIEPEGFVVPVSDFSWNGIELSKGKVDLGKVFVRNSKEIFSFLDLLEETQKDKVSLWFTPLYFSINRGVLKLNRVDMLLMDRYPLATWGNLDFSKKKIKMVLGVCEKSLENAFGIKSLPKGFMLQLPFEGNFKNARIDKGKAAARIGSLIAKKNVETKDPLLNAVVNVAFNEFTNHQPHPPPSTTCPFPWSA